MKTITKRVGGLLVIGLTGIVASLFIDTGTPLAKDLVVPLPQALVATKEAKPVIQPPQELWGVKTSDWQLALVGPGNPVKAEPKAEELGIVEGNYQLDQRIVKNYQTLREAAATAGVQLQLVSAYRSVSYQGTIFQEAVNAAMVQEGLSEAAATAKVKLTMTEAGFSEHHTGLALDVVDEEWLATSPANMLEAAYGDFKGAQWLAKNAPTYGFIIRYPKNKESVTQITYEPWHLRYVGVENAKYISSHQLTLEQYLALVEQWQQQNSGNGEESQDEKAE